MKATTALQLTIALFMLQTGLFARALYQRQIALNVARAAVMLYLRCAPGQTLPRPLLPGPNGHPLRPDSSKPLPGYDVAENN